MAIVLGWRKRAAVLSIVSVALAAVVLAGAASAPAAQAQTVSDVEVRDQLIADQEALLNVYRCMFDIDTHIVPGGCADGSPKLPAKTPHPFSGAPTAQEIAVRDQLVADQEALLNTYRCLFDIDTHIVPDKCRQSTSPPTTPNGPDRAPTPKAGEEQTAEQALSELVPWMFDPSDDARSWAVIPFQEIWERDAEFARELAAAPWLGDGIVGWETNAIYGLGRLMDRDRALARRILAYSVEEPVQTTNVLLLQALGDMTWQNPESFELLIRQPWFVDGLDPEERAFIIPLVKTPGSHSIFEALLASRSTLTKTITLPLSGDVDLWAFHHHPFLPHEDILAEMEQGLRSAERLVGAPLPLDDIIVLSIDARKYGTTFGGITWGNEILLFMDRGQALDTTIFYRDVLYHELAHIYLVFDIAPLWLVEGGANFIAEFARTALDSDNWNGQMPVNEDFRANCAANGIPNVHALSDPNPPDADWLSTCQYILGQYFVTRLFNTIGEAAFSSALRELHQAEQNIRYRYRPPTEEETYLVFRKHTPPDRQAAFLALYRQIHGGPFL